MLVQMKPQWQMLGHGQYARLQSHLEEEEPAESVIGLKETLKKIRLVINNFKCSRFS